jgi:hypothetical protein
MGKKLLNYLVVLSGLFFGLLICDLPNLSAQEETMAVPRPESANPSKFQGSISEEEMRILDFKKLATESNMDFPEEIHLFFQELQGDYAVFYDRNGHLAQYRYRRNKWDQEAKDAVHNLLPGRSYKVRGRFQGFLFFGVNSVGRRQAMPIWVPQGPNLSLEIIQDPQSIPVYQLVSYTETYSDQIILEIQ